MGSWTSNRGCTNADSTIRLIDAEDGTHDSCYEACEAGGYNCCRMNFDYDTPRCHGGVEGVEFTDNYDHKATLVCLNIEGKLCSCSFSIISISTGVMLLSKK